MFVEKWMTPNPFTLPPHTTISAAALEMGKHHFRHLLVAEPGTAGKKLLGLLSKYDIARAFPDNYNPFSPDATENTVPKPISSIMIHNVVTVEPYCAVEEAVRILRTRRINALLVVRNGNLVGIITETDIFDAILDMSGANGSSMRLVVESDDVKNALASMTQVAEQFQLHMLNALSYHDRESPNKVISVFHFSNKANSSFVQELCRRRFRVVKID